MKQIICILSFLTLVGCATAQYEYQEGSLEQLDSGYTSKSVLSAKQAIEKFVSNNNVISLGKKTYINEKTAEVVMFDGYKSPSLVAMVDNGISQLFISSYVVTPDNGSMYLFYPVLTAFDSDKNRISEILPKYEFDFKNNVLINSFTIPPKSRFILVHSKPKYIGMKFLTETSDTSHALTAAFFGGLLGYALNEAAGEQNFQFASVGAVSLKTELEARSENQPLEPVFINGRGEEVDIWGQVKE